MIPAIPTMQHTVTITYSNYLRTHFRRKNKAIKALDINLHASKLYFSLRSSSPRKNSCGKLTPTTAHKDYLNKMCHACVQGVKSSVALPRLCNQKLMCRDDLRRFPQEVEGLDATQEGDEEPNR